MQIKKHVATFFLSALLNETSEARPPRPMDTMPMFRNHQSSSHGFASSLVQFSYQHCTKSFFDDQWYPLVAVEISGDDDGRRATGGASGETIGGEGRRSGRRSAIAVEGGAPAAPLACASGALPLLAGGCPGRRRGERRGEQQGRSDGIGRGGGGERRDWRRVRDAGLEEKRVVARVSHRGCARFIRPQ